MVFQLSQYVERPYICAQRRRFSGELEAHYLIDTCLSSRSNYHLLPRPLDLSISSSPVSSSVSNQKLGRDQPLNVKTRLSPHSALRSPRPTAAINNSLLDPCIVWRALRGEDDLEHLAAGFRWPRERELASEASLRQRRQPWSALGQERDSYEVEPWCSSSFQLSHTYALLKLFDCYFTRPAADLLRDMKRSTHGFHFKPHLP